MARILVFGDSITYGAWDTMRGGWADRLKSFCMEKELENSRFDYAVYNLGISGDNTENVLRRLENEINCRIWKDEKIIIIFAIGVNDSWFINSENSFKVAPDNFRNNLKEIIKISQKFSSSIAFIGLTPVDEIRTILWDIDISYKNEYISNYDNIIKLICRENNIHFIDMFGEFNKVDYKKLLEDGLHPNSEGHQKMFEIVRNYLLKKGIIEKNKRLQDVNN